MSASITDVRGIVRASRLVDSSSSGASQTFSLDALRGRLVEISLDAGTPSFSLVSLLLREAQVESEPAAWIATGASVFYPPDFAANGIDIGRLPVVATEGREQALRAAEHLLRSGAFGLIVIDFERSGSIAPGRLGTLNRLAALQRSLIVFLNGREHELGSLISVRFSAELEREKPNRFICRIRATKDKRAPEGWSQELVFRGTDGLY